MVGPLVALTLELPRIAGAPFLGVPGGIRPAIRAALWVSLRTATIAVAVDALLGIPLGVWLARTRSPAATAGSVAATVRGLKALNPSLTISAPMGPTSPSRV